MTERDWVKEIIDNRKNYRKQELKCCGSCKHKIDDYNGSQCKLAYSITNNKILYENELEMIEIFGDITTNYEYIDELNICDAFEKLAEGE